jgi:copper homeostasis protein
MTSGRPFTLEIACFSLEGAQQAQQSGAHRIELCENPYEGGTTPSFGTLQVIRKIIQIPVFPIIRPRGGHFHYSPEEVDVMRNDITLCRQLGFQGVVIGLLHADGSVDEVETAKLVELAYPMEVTFHRAFDRTRDPFEALETIIRCGCQRILTSGLRPEAPNGAGLIASLIHQADDRIIIMPGSGVRSGNIRSLASETKAIEFHTAARLSVHNENVFQPLSMEERLTHTSVDTKEVFALLNELNNYFAVEKAQE